MTISAPMAAVNIIHTENNNKCHLIGIKGEWWLPKSNTEEATTNAYHLLF